MNKEAIHIIKKIIMKVKENKSPEAVKKTAVNNAKASKSHKNIAEQLEKAAKKHYKAAKHHEAGDLDKAHSSTIKAHDHMSLASEAQTDMLKHYSFAS